MKRRVFLSVPVLMSFIFFRVELSNARRLKIPHFTYNKTLSDSPLYQFFGSKTVTSTATTNQLPNCNNWLYLPSKSSYIRVGDLDIPGNKITVEALVMRTKPYSGGPLFAGDIVSKHEDVTDINYLLRPNGAEITTSNSGYVKTPDICEIELNKTYHVAMVYDGSTLKFYRNGFLMSQAPASGDLHQNNWQTQIGLYYNQITNEQLIGYVNEVRIWNVARTQAQICEFMQTSLPSPATQPGLLAYYTFDNLLNKQGNAAWNGSLGGGAVINQTNPTCSNFVIDSCGLTSGDDFSFSSSSCDPFTVQFKPLGTPVAGDWSFGDGNFEPGVSSPSHTYAASGNYTVAFTPYSGGCPKTITKQINVSVVPDDIIPMDQVAICNGEAKRLSAVSSLSYCWSPTTYLDDPGSANPTTNANQNITYFLNALVPGNNLVVNGDFSAGNSGFTSQYSFASNNSAENQYFVGPNPQAWNPGFGACPDHTTSSGNMMLLNGSADTDVVVWQQTVNVTPNTNYAFSTWIQSLVTVNPARLQFAINGNTIGDVITASLPTCTWAEFYSTWNSGSSTTAVISIMNKNKQMQGNDFALDDILFAPVSIKRDSVIVTVENPNVRTGNDTTICSGAPAVLNATGAATYSWAPSTGLSDNSIANPVASPLINTQYIVTGTTLGGCTARDTVLISVYPLPSISKSSDTAICRNMPVSLFVSGGETYSWSPASSLDNPSLSNPVAAPDTSTTYYVRITDEYTCSYTDSIRVNIKAVPLFSVSPDQSACYEHPITLHATGGDSYNWSPAASLNNPQSADPVATPNTTTIYSVYISENTCNYDTTLSLTLTVNPNPTVFAEKSNDITCTTPTSQLRATGAIQYQWTPVTALNFPDIPDPRATVDTTTVFTVVGTNEFGCTASDTVTVKFIGGANPLFAMPNAFTPNNDGNNDCFGIRHWGHVTLMEFSIYNRWGQRVFNTTDPGQCWDGMLNGRYLDNGGYVYVIRAATLCGVVKRTGIVMLLR